MSSTSVYDVELKDDETCVSVLRYFLDVAAKRGAFSLTEAGRIMQALQVLEKGDGKRIEAQSEET